MKKHIKVFIMFAITLCIANAAELIKQQAAAFDEIDAKAKERQKRRALALQAMVEDAAQKFAQQAVLLARINAEANNYSEQYQDMLDNALYNAEIIKNAIVKIRENGIIMTKQAQDRLRSCINDGDVISIIDAIKDVLRTASN